LYHIKVNHILIKPYVLTNENAVRSRLCTLKSGGRGNKHWIQKVSQMRSKIRISIPILWNMYSLNSFPSIKCNCSTTKEIENIMSFKSSNSFGCDKVSTKILRFMFPLH